jgi:hypothetical protein
MRSSSKRESLRKMSGLRVTSIIINRMKILMERCREAVVLIKVAMISHYLQQYHLQLAMSKLEHPNLSV